MLASSLRLLTLKWIPSVDVRTHMPIFLMEFFTVLLAGEAGRSSRGSERLRPTHYRYLR